MKRSTVELYIDPSDGSNLTLSEDQGDADAVCSGKLVSANGNQFSVTEGVPNLIFPFILPEADRKSLQQSEERADAYDRYLPLTFKTYGEDEDQVRNAMINKLNLKPSNRVLEVGAGTGRDSELIIKRLDSAGCLFVQDISPSFLKQNIAKLQQTGKQFEASLANGYYLPFPDNTFDACFHFGGINAFADIARAFSEMARVTKSGGKVVVGDESMPPWLRHTEYGKILMNSNPEFSYPIPLDKLPVEARKTRIEWIIGGVFYVVDFEVGKGEPTANLDFPIPGVRGGTHRTRYCGQLEGVTLETKALAYKARARCGESMHQWLDKVVREAAQRDLDN